MKNYAACLWGLSFCFTVAFSGNVYSAEREVTNPPVVSEFKSRSGYGENGKSGKTVMDLEDFKDPNDPDSLWYHYNRDYDRELDLYPKIVMQGKLTVSKKYNKKAFPHLKKMAVYCNQQWADQKCLRGLSALGVDLTKDYMKKIYYSEDVSADLKAPSQKKLREECAALVVGPNEEVIPAAMNGHIKRCLNAINAVSNLTEAYPDTDLRQLAMSATFCIIRQPPCNMIEGQLEMIAKPIHAKTVEAQPVEGAPPESEPTQTPTE
tara:strand:- start:5800 stop:6591 length:792 start_codon:yes stop_codon:yes gene_type:complete